MASLIGMVMLAMNIEILAEVGKPCLHCLAVCILLDVTVLSSLFCIVMRVY